MSTEKVPRVLYKFLAPQRVSVLEDCLVGLTPPAEFNDPFEAYPAIAGLFGANPANIIANGALEAMRQDGLTIDDDTGAEVAAEIAAWNTSASSELPSIVFRTASRQLGILSLTSANANALMWAHYARSHRGFAVGFDSRNQFFDRRQSPEDPINHLRPVNYRADRPEVYLFDESDRARDAARLALELFLTKSIDWSYEAEWRLISALAWADETRKVNGQTLYLFRFTPQAVVEVILGHRVDESLAARILGLVRTQEALAHIRLLRARPHPRRFEMELLPLDA